MKTPRTIEIIGGGVAGLSLGLALRRHDVPVTLYEAGDYPRHRVCGEFISGLDESTEEQLGLRKFLTDAKPHRAVSYHLRDRPLRPFALPATALGISRHTFDARLAGAFVAAGGDLRTGTRIPEDDRPPGRVMAVGRNRSGPFWIGLKIHIHGLVLDNDFEVHLGDRAYLGLSRVENGAVNLCGIFGRRPISARGANLIPAYLEACGLHQLAERVRSAATDPSTFCVTAASLGDRHVAEPDRVRIGDACATIPPFTGNGLAMAFQGAALAVEPLRAYAWHESEWDESAQVIAVTQRRRFRRRLLLASVLHPFFLVAWRQRLLAELVGSGLVPFRTLYSALH